ncbi:uncharacterized protein EI90DRAFT_377070 [Cantharellus anzutake]|uniref:uncharacterized protein n=1 Tax=Cantharellus anzutake TaxID=1750568 RepID=UPI00190848C2|nr:uncharacterized protein EI90DRAFT_377070 [Cantharellus anzutake]KAF8334928.1 hypothetical protein EI90DRAFT_377070 [Cantharellus anzutake]
MQESLLKHLKEAKNRFVWLRGSPGMGKTAISMSIASTLEKEGTLAASYFWDKNRAGTGLDSIEQFPFTLAHQLACFNEDFKFSLVRHLRKPALASVQNFPLKKQMKTLMIEPMRDLKDIFPSGKDRFIIVLDGLDECGNQETLESLMELVLTLQELPTGFSVLVSCRPERGVISAWSEAQADGLVIPCEDVDKIQWETFHTIRQMVKEGLRGFVKESSWKPTESELNGFALACRGLPVVASIRVRDVHVQTRRGRTLQSAFQNLLTLTHVPTDLDQEYLRILRQAYVLGSSGIPSDVAKTYRLVVGTIVVAREPMNVSFISQLFEVDENEIYAILEPISSIVDLREETLGVTFYDASAKEFLMGEPVGNEEDKVFFIDDVKGYFLGLPLLRLFNGNCEQNVFGVPADLPLGNERKWGEFMAKKYHFQYRWRFHYVVRYLLEHLDPSQLFSRESNELQNEFDSFITRNYLLTWLHLQNEKLIGDNASLFPEELLQFNNHSSVQLLRELHWLAWIAASEPWSLYRSELPFTPLSSPLHKQYGHLSDPVRILSFFGKFSGGTIPLSEDSLRAQEVMMAKLGEPREQSDGLDEETSEPDEDTNGSEEAINHDAEFQEPDVRNGIVTCAALSLDGRYVALGFGSGIIEVADIDHQQTICRLQHDSANLPVWIEFVHGSHRIASEDINGNVTILGGGMAPAKPGTLPPGSYPPGTAVSDNGLFIARAPRTLDNPWCDNMTLISVSGIPTLKHLAPPPFSLSSSSNDEKLVIPHRRTLGFSPGARYICTFDGIHAVTWSTDSCQCISGYRVTNFERWIINPTVPPSHPHSIPDPIFTRTTLPLPESDTAYAHCSEVEAEDDSGDESWIKRPFYDFSPSRLRWNELRYSSVATRIPLLGSHISGRCSVWLNGREELELPWDYQPIDSQQAWYGHRVPHDSLGLYRPQSSRDGTRFLVQGWRRAPIVIDIS